MIRNIDQRRDANFLLGAAILLAALSQLTVLRAAEPPARTVSLAIDYGDGAERHFPRLAWRDGMTVLDLMQAAKAHPRGIAFEHRGRGATAFLLRIDDVKNEGRGRNWLYRINGKLADRSFAVQTIHPDDQIRWEFSRYQEN
jgi:hypothetical protein